jgi:fatty acid desaturase
MSATRRFRLDSGELKQLALRSDAPAAWRVLGHFGAIGLAATALWFAMSTPWAIPLTVVLGYLVAFLFTAEHEAAHQTAFRTRRWNYALGHLAGFAILLPYEYYRAFHWDHHRYTQDEALDPELHTPVPTSRLGLAWYLTGLPNWRDRLRLLFLHGVLGRVTARWVPEDKRPLIAREARCYLGAYLAVIAVSVAFRSPVAVWLWVVPVMVGQLFLRPYLLVEHTGCSSTPDMLDNTRTTYTNAFVRYFAWNMPYHVEHHAYPAVPFHALPRLNAALGEHITNASRSYRSSGAAVLRHLGRARDPDAATSLPSPPERNAS